MSKDIWSFFSSLFMVSSLRLLMIWSTYHVQNWRILFPTISLACRQFLIWISPPILGEHLGTWDALFDGLIHTISYVIFFFCILAYPFPLLTRDEMSTPCSIIWLFFWLLACLVIPASMNFYIDDLHVKIIYLDVYSFYSECTCELNLLTSHNSLCTELSVLNNA